MFNLRTSAKRHKSIYTAGTSGGRVKIFRNLHTFSLSSSHETDSDFRVRNVNECLLPKSPSTKDLKVMPLTFILGLKTIME